MNVELQIRVQDLMARYAAALDAGRYEAWPGFFTEDARYKIISAENFERDLPLGVIDCDSRAMLEDRVMALREANIYEDHRYRHVIAPPVILSHENDMFSAATSYHVARIMREGETDMFSTGRYLDRIVERDGALLFAERLVVFDSRRIDTLLVFPI